MGVVPGEDIDTQTLTSGLAVWAAADLLVASVAEALVVEALAVLAAEDLAEAALLVAGNPTFNKKPPAVAEGSSITMSFSLE